MSVRKLVDFYTNQAKNSEDKVPLKSGSDQKTISANIKELMSKGHSQQESIAIALDYARREIENKYKEREYENKDQK